MKNPQGAQYTTGVLPYRVQLLATLAAAATLHDCLNLMHTAITHT